MRCMKRLALLLLCVALLFSLAGCGNKPYKYKGNHADLYTVANNSLLWTTGYSILTEYRGDPAITIIEEDAYGRVLFSYTEKDFATNVKGNDIFFPAC